MNEKEKELLENFRGMSSENQINMLTYAHATRLAEITTKRRYGLLPEVGVAECEPMVKEVVA